MHRGGPPNEGSGNLQVSAEPQTISSPTQMQRYSGSGRHGLLILRVLCLGLVAAGIFVLYRRGELTREHLTAVSASMSVWIFVPAYFLLPIFGFPISVVLVASGVKFGLLRSIALAVSGMAFHTVIAYRLANGGFRRPLARLLGLTDFGRATIPDKHQSWMTSLFVLAPGLPYAVKLYVVAFTDLSFRRYVLIVWPLHVMHAIPFIAVGAAAATINAGGMLALGVLALGAILVSGFVSRLLKTSRAKQSTQTVHPVPADSKKERSPQGHN